MKPYGFRAAGIVAAPLQTKSNYVYFRSATLSGGAVDDTIIVTSQGGGQELILQPGQGCSIDETVTDWLVYNSSGVGQIDGVLLFGRGHFTDNRPSGQTAIVGTVSVQGTVRTIDDAKSRTLSGVAFTTYSGKAGGGVGYPAVQLWNKNTSGKNLVVETIEASCDVASTIHIKNGTAALAALDLAKGYAKKLGSADSVAMEVRSENPAAVPGTNILVLSNLLANTPWKKDFKEPYIVVPNSGILVVLGTIAGRIDVNFEWYEDPV